MEAAGTEVGERMASRQSYCLLGKGHEESKYKCSVVGNATTYVPVYRALHGPGYEVLSRANEVFQSVPISKRTGRPTIGDVSRAFKKKMDEDGIARRKGGMSRVTTRLAAVFDDPDINEEVDNYFDQSSNEQEN